MNFIYADQAVKAPTFGDVKNNQFFVDDDGYLCQKTNGDSFTVIAKPDGTPCSTWFRNVRSDQTIQRIIPAVQKIEF